MNKQKCLTAYECYQAIGELGKSQGFYSRMYETLTEWYEDNDCKWEMWEDFCKDNHITSVVELVFALEC